MNAPTFNTNLQPVALTVFADERAKSSKRVDTTWGELVQAFRNPTEHPSKAACPFIKLATFGDTRTDKGSLRHDANVQAVTGIELDYDGEQVALAAAAALLRQAGIAAVVYSSPSYTAAKPRWRVLCPTSATMPPDQRAPLLARLDALLGGVASSESYALSQSYYFGHVSGVEYVCEVTDGLPVDTAAALGMLPEGEVKVKQSKAAPVGNWQPLPADFEAVLNLRPCPAHDDKGKYIAEWMPTVLGALNTFGPAAVPGLVRWSMPWYQAKHEGKDEVTVAAIAERDITKRIQPEGDGKATWENVREARGLPRVDVQDKFPPVPAQQEQDPVWPGGWEWEPPVDILDDKLTVPPYDTKAGYLTKSYERMMEANYRYHLHASREAYAGFFTSAVDMHLRPSVTVEERPGAAANGGTMYALVDQSGLVGASTKGKTATLMHTVGHERTGSLLNAWNGREQAAALKKMDAAIAEIRAKHPGDDKVVAEKIRALKAATPVPDIVNSKITDKSLIATIASNVIHDLPTDLVIDEWENVYGGAAYRRDGGNSISDIHRKMFDGEAYSDKAQGTGKISAEMTLGNLAFACTPDDMARWKGYEAAMTNGDMARKSLYAPGAPFDGERDQSIDFGAIAEWRRVQKVLETLRDVKMTLEVDPDFERRVDKAVEEFGRQADGGDHVARWLAKSRIRMARMAARLWLVEQIEDGHVPSGAVMIPKAYRRRAWKYLTEFAWPHQVYVHNRLIAGESFKTALQVLLRRIYANKLTTIKKDDLVGSRASLSLQRGGEEFIKVLLNTYHWIRPKATRKMAGVNLNRPWEAHQFEVNPMLCSVYLKYDDELLRQHEVAKGQIRDIFDREDF